MTAKSKWRGHTIVWQIKEKRFVYADTGEPTSGKERACGHCNRESKDDIDPCLGKLPGVINACCGHGNPKEAYVQFENGTIVKGFDCIYIATEGERRALGICKL